MPASTSRSPTRRRGRGHAAAAAFEHQRDSIKHDKSSTGKGRAGNGYWHIAFKLLRETMQGKSKVAPNNTQTLFGFSFLSSFIICILLIWMLITITTSVTEGWGLSTYRANGSRLQTTFTNRGFDVDPRWGDLVNVPEEGQSPEPPLMNWMDVKRELIHPRNASKLFNRANVQTMRLTRAMSKKKGKRTFGCLRDGCRGLAIEDLIDRGWRMQFKSSLDNETNTYKDINYKVNMLLSDTTTLNNVENVRPELWKQIISGYEGNTYVSAFVGGDAIGGNKGQQLRVKAKYAKRSECKYNNLGIQPAQYRLYIKEECEDMYEAARLQPSLTWLLKPEAGSQGQGITFHQDAKEIKSKRPEFFPCRNQKLPAPQRVLVQQYIEKPLLLQGTKFDVRCYMMLVGGFDPWLVFYHEGYLRRSLHKYSPLSKDRKVYLTNTHYQSMKKGFKLSEHIWTFGMMQEYLKDNHVTGSHYVESALNPYIKQVVQYVFQSARKRLKPRKGSFQIFGLDFMIDESFHVHFIEANGYPGFTWSINFDSRQMVEDHFNLAVELNEAPGAMRRMRSGDRYGSWELVHSDIEDGSLGRNYDPCEELGDNNALTMPLTKANEVYAKISGRAGNTLAFDDPKVVQHRVPGWELIGGEKHISLISRVRYAKKQGCDYWQDLKIEPKMWRMFVENECKELFREEKQKLKKRQDSNNNADEVEDNGASNNQMYIAKHVQGTGDGDGLTHFASIYELEVQFRPCRDMPANWIVQRRINDPLMLDLERVARPGVQRDDLGNAIPSPPSHPPESQGVRDSELPFETEQWRITKMGPARVQYDVRAYMLVASLSPLVVMYHDGFVRSVRNVAVGENEIKNSDEMGGQETNIRKTMDEIGGQAEEEELNDKDNEPSDGKKGLGSDKGEYMYHGVRLGEHVMNMSAFQFHLAVTQRTGPQYVSSVLVPHINRVMEYVVHATRDNMTSEWQLGEEMPTSVKGGNKNGEALPPRPHKQQLFAFNFAIDEEFGIHLMGVSGDDTHAGFFSNHPSVVDIQRNMNHTRRELVLELRAAPIGFIRMRRGDAYGGFRVVISEMEESLYDDQPRKLYNPCKVLAPRSQAGTKVASPVSPEQVRAAASLQIFADKQFLSHKREMKKYITKRWDYCKRKSTRELQADCVRDTVELRYKNFAAKERLEVEEGYVEKYIREMQNRHPPPQVPRWKLVNKKDG